METENKYDVIVIGAGAAGMMAAGVAAREGRRVLVLEKMEKPGRKIRISGKGRCNVTNTKPREEFLEHIRSGREFFEPSFRQFDNRATIPFFRRLGVKLIEERGGRIFPESGKSWDIADALADWAKDEGDAEILRDTPATDIVAVAGRILGVKIRTKRGYPRTLETDNVIIATGGVSYPSTGSTGDGYSFAHALGHTIVPVRPSLVPIESDTELAQALVGMSLRNVGLSLVVDGETVQEEFGEMQFAKRGLEGAVILRISRAAVDALIDERQVEVVLDLKPALDREQLLARIEREIRGLTEIEENGATDEDAAEADGEARPRRRPDRATNDEGAMLGELMRKLMPRPLVAPILRLLDADSRMPLARMTDGQKNSLAFFLKELRIPITDYRPFEEAVITAGGVALDEIDPATLQSRLVRGLYFAGEVLDIDADTGGYNIQVALSTGHLAGKLRK